MDGSPEAQLASLRAELGRLQARDRELSALVSSTRELVEVRDVQPLLQKLVDRAHDLMGTDVTYLSEYDESTDELFVRATHGAVSTNIQGLRVPAGVGLASEVVNSRSAQWTSSYLSAGFQRDDKVSAAVEAEHMESILGVPLISSDRVLGALFAADRSTHGFRADQIALLRAFADQGAVILQTARLLAAARDSAERAARATADAERRASAMEASAQLHERLTALVLAGGGPEAMVETAAVSLGRSVALTDRNSTRLATSDASAESWWDEDRLLPGWATAIAESRETGRCVRLADEQAASGYVVAAMAGATFLGAVLVGGPDLDDVEMRSIERCAQIHALVTMQRDALADAEERVRGELVADLISGYGDPDALRRRAAQRGIDLGGEWMPVVATGFAAERWGLARALATVDQTFLVAQHDGEVVALVPGAEEPTTVAARLHTRLTARFAAGLVAVGPRGSVTEVGRGLNEALTLARLLPGLGITDRAATTDEFAPYLALFGTDGARAQRFAEGILGPVLDWDGRHHSVLTATLAAYLDNQGSVTRAAATLLVHPNTVKQRLARIDELLGAGWREPDHQFRLGVAINIHRMTETAIPS